MTEQPKHSDNAFSKHFHEGQAQTYDEVLALDSRPIPDILRQVEDTDVGPTQVPTRWYLDRAVHELEKETIWKRSWQMACRASDLAEIGDSFVYTICDMSFLLVRSTANTIKGYWNACLHRGVELRSCAGRVDRIQCPFHGFTWSLDGKCLLIPYPEEFPHIAREQFGLPEIQVAEWNDFIFVNPDLTAESFDAYAGTFTTQLDRWPYTGRYKALHFAKIFPVNWKALQEAFMESWHVLTVHPQFAGTTADRCSQIWASGNYSRGIVPQAQTSDYVAQAPSEQEMFNRYMGVWEDETTPKELELPEGVGARQMLANQARAMLRPALGDRVEEFCDSEVIDVIYWTLFPNFNPFGAYNQPFVYRFYPHQDDHTRSVMEGMFLLPLREGVDAPPAADIIWLTEGQDFTAIKELGSFGSFLSQDVANMGTITRGLRNNRAGHVNFASWHELKLRHFYAVYEKMTGLSAAGEIASRSTPDAIPRNREHQ